jgi:hypothetical protein
VKSSSISSAAFDVPCTHTYSIYHFMLHQEAKNYASIIPYVKQQTYKDSCWKLHLNLPKQKKVKLMIHKQTCNRKHENHPKQIANEIVRYTHFPITKCKWNWHLDTFTGHLRMKLMVTNNFPEKIAKENV